MRAWLTTSLAAALLASPAHAYGQSVPSSLTAGTRVRVAIPDAAAQRETPFIRTQLVRGEVLRITADTIVLRPAPQLGELPIPLAGVRRLDVSLGPPRRASSALIRGVEQAVLLALAGAVLYSDGDREFGVTNRGEAAALGAGIGLVGGAITGALAPFERWRRVPLPARP